MKALFIEDNALRSLVSHRDYQSGEFAKALDLINHIRNSQNEEYRIDDIAIITHKEITYVYSKVAINLNRAIIFDFRYLGEMLTLNDEDFMMSLQKILKCTLKSWEKLPFNTASEKNISDNHIILFPFPFSNLNSFKILLNAAPDSEYTLKRNMTYMYVANAGYGEFPLEYNKINIKSLKNDAQAICALDSPKNANINSVTDLSVTKLQDLPNKKDCYIDYESWMHLLTTPQTNFITKQFNGNERLEGAAGTGKTLSLILRAIYLLKYNHNKDNEFHIIFIAHSIATKLHLQNMIQMLCPNEIMLDRSHSKQSITITTLQEWCTKYLGDKIGSSEVIDLDAQETKENQMFFLKEIYEDTYKNDFPSYKSKCSDSFIYFLENTDIDVILDLLQSEISITIKGRAKEDFDIYQTLDRLECSMPISSHGDYSFVFLLYERYQSVLSGLGYFDNDDISLSALGQLDTPIWRRRRKEIGYDAIIIDETHLFSYNELSLFHFLSKESSSTKIIYAVDKTQAIGDRGLTKKTLEESLNISTEDKDRAKYKTIFRSSPEIINLAFSVLTSGAGMFVNFENPLDRISTSFVDFEEKKSIFPQYIMMPSDEDIVESCFENADTISRTLDCPKNNILIVCTTQELLSRIEKTAKILHKPCEFLKRRGDMEVVKTAQKNKRYVVGYIDYVGGLEFDGVIIAGVDKGRVPTTNGNERSSYQSYAWYNRIYVALTRAKYSVILLGNKSRTISPFFEKAISEEKITFIEK